MPLAPIGLTVAILGVFGWIASWSRFVAPDDEAIYLLMARWLYEGVLPYRDYFFGHPPGRLVLAFPFAAPSQADPTWAHLVPAGFFALAAIGATVAVARHVSRAWAPLAAFSLLLVGPVLREGALLRGMAPVAAAAAWSLVLLGRGRWRSAGLLMSLAGLTALHVAPLLVAVGAVAWAHRRSGALRGYLVGLAPLAVGFGALALAFGEDFVGPVLGYHLQKTQHIDYAATRQASFLLSFLESAAPVVVLAAVGGALVLLGDRVPASLRPTRPADRTVQRAALLMAALYLLALAGFSSVHRYFLCLLMPPLALLATRGAQGVVGLIGEASAPAWTARVAAITLVTALGVASADGLGNQWNRTRQLPETEAGIRRVAAAVDARLPPGESLIGDSNLVPWIAWLTGRRIAARQVDLNHKRFLVGELSPQRLLDEAEADGLGGVVVVSQQGFDLASDLMRALKSRYRRAAVWTDIPGMRAISLYEPPS